MSLFKKSKGDAPELPKLPDLPELPSAPEFGESSNLKLHELPSFPSNEFGEKFSHDSIKHAVEGKEDISGFPHIEEKKEKEEKDFDKPEPPRSHEIKEDKEIDKIIPKKVVAEEPVFVQIDKFEDAIQTFGKIKENLKDMEKLLSEVKELKQKEEREISHWENEIQSMKTQIANIDEDIFSKI